MRGHWAVLLDAALRAGFAVNLLEPINASRISIDGGMAPGPGVDQNLLRRKVGMVFQSFNLFPHLSVEENIMTGPMHRWGESH